MTQYDVQYFAYELKNTDLCHMEPNKQLIEITNKK